VPRDSGRLAADGIASFILKARSLYAADIEKMSKDDAWLALTVEVLEVR
jgi:hypothetical protein